MPPLMVEIIAYAPTQFYHCKHCEVIWQATEAPGTKKWHDDMLETSMPAEMMQEYRNLSDWIINAAEQYGGRVVFQVIDATTLQGVWKAFKHRVRKFPAVIIDGTAKSIGENYALAQTLIDQRLAASI